MWVHTQDMNEPSYYAVYFDVSPAPVPGPSPAPWIGDVDVLRREHGQSLGGFAHFCATVGDYDGDRLFDLIAGTEKGDLMWFPNRGTPGRPARYKAARTEHGGPSAWPSSARSRSSSPTRRSAI